MSRAPLPDSARGEAPMPSSFDDNADFWNESGMQKIKRKLKQEPLVPLGLGLTCYALFNAARSMRKGDKAQTNRWFRARVYAQAFTLICVCGGALYWKEDREKRKKYQGLLSEKMAQEKKEAWIKELEARDREAEVERQRKALMRKRRMEDSAAAAARSSVPARSAKEEQAGPVAEQSGNDVNASPLDSERLRGLVVGSTVLEQVLSLWRYPDRRDQGVEGD